MNYIISGLPATGKTTICKNVALKTNLTYVNDYEILKSIGISFENNSAILLKDYSKYILDYLKDKDNLIVDLQHTLSPKQIKGLNVIAFCLEFTEIEPKQLFRILSKKDNTITLERAKLFVEKSKQIKEQCEKESISYYDIGTNRDEIINEIICKIIRK